MVSGAETLGNCSFRCGNYGFRVGNNSASFGFDLKLGIMPLSNRFISGAETAVFGSETTVFSPETQIVGAKISVDFFRSGNYRF